MTDLPPVEYLDEAARVFGYTGWASAADWSRTDRVRISIIAHAHALHRIAELEAKLPRETLEDVARREACDHYDSPAQHACFTTGFLRGVQMQKEGVLPDE